MLVIYTPSVKFNIIFYPHTNTTFFINFFYQYQLALFQIDSLRQDGRFIGSDGSIPEGQGIINANLSECHELVEMVKFILYLTVQVVAHFLSFFPPQQLKESMDEGVTDEEYDDEDEYIYDSPPSIAD